MNWLHKILPPKIKANGVNNKAQIPEGLWSKCDNCQEPIYSIEFEKNLRVCSKCNYHHNIPARTRFKFLFDDQKFTEIATDISTDDPLKFKDLKSYLDRLKQAKKTSGENEAIVVASGKINKINTTVAVFEYNFIGGSMGSVVGEKFIRGISYAVKNTQPFVVFSSSGGARMQEGLYSLMQMAKTTTALNLLNQNSLPFINVLTNPTMGGVSASFAMIADVVIAEPKALVGFAGPRVIEQTVREVLPEGFQRSEFLLEKGAIDTIIDRRKMRDQIALILDMLLGDSYN